MRIDDILEQRRPCFSFEFFPPKDDEGVARLLATIGELEQDDPGFVSVTYGAGGSTRTRTIEMVTRIRRETNTEVMAHLTCAGSTRDELQDVLGELRDAGVENVLALRGDPPAGDSEWKPTPGGLSYSTELAALVSADYDFAIGAACFPEVHPEAPDMASDIGFLKDKVAAGASFLISQLFFDSDLYFDFVEQVRAAGVTVPILPGIMPITNYSQLKRFTEMCGATIPDRLDRELAPVAEDKKAVEDLGVAYATLQCSDLLARGAPGIHFFTLNRSPATRSILAALRAARPWDRARSLV